MKQSEKAAPSPAQSLATLKTLIAKAAAGTLNTRASKSPTGQTTSGASSTRSSLSPGVQSKVAKNTGKEAVATSAFVAAELSPKNSPQIQRPASSLSSSSASSQASYEEPAKSRAQDENRSELEEPRDITKREQLDKLTPSPLPAITSTSTSTGTDPEPIEKLSADNDYWQEEKVKMENAQSYQSFQKGSILKKSLTSKGTSPPPQTISTQVILYLMKFMSYRSLISWLEDV